MCVTKLYFNGLEIEMVQSEVPWHGNVILLSRKIAVIINIEMIKKQRFLPVRILKLLYFSFIHSTNALSEMKVLQRKFL